MGSRILWGWLLLTVCVSPVSAQAPDADVERLEEQAFQQSAALVADSLVRIETVGGLEEVEGWLTPAGPTTGVVVGADGWILSSTFNFAARPSQIIVTLADGRRFPAQEVAQDRLKYLTLLKIDATGLAIPKAAEPERVRVGQWALALGRTLDDQAPSVSVGIISALHRIWGKALQTDAKVSPVNYGGLLINVQGEALGILVPLSPQAQGTVAGVEWYDSGIGFAIPFTDALAVLERLKQGENLLPGLMGISFQSQDEFAGELLINRVRYGAPAQKAGVKTGDRIVAVNGQEISRIAEFRQIVGTKYAGDKILLNLRRDEQAISADITLEGVLVPYELPWLGVMPERLDVTQPAALPGVALRAVLPGSPAQAAGVMVTERILQVEDRAVDNAAALADAITRQRPGDQVTLTLQTGNDEPRRVALTLGKWPTQVPDQLAAGTIPPGAIDPNNAEATPTGVLRDKGAENSLAYWAYVPPTYNLNYDYGLVVWLHPPGQPMTEAVQQAWKTHCDQRGLILLAPQAQSPETWEPTEAELIHAQVLKFQKTYRIDPKRIVVHGLQQGGELGGLLAVQKRETYRGLVVFNSRLPRQFPENEPDQRLQLFFGRAGDRFPQRIFDALVKTLEQQKVPVTTTSCDLADTGYLPEKTVEELARWVDLLDQI